MTLSRNHRLSIATRRCSVNNPASLIVMHAMATQLIKFSSVDNMKWYRMRSRLSAERSTLLTQSLPPPIFAEIWPLRFAFHHINYITFTIKCQQAHLFLAILTKNQICTPTICHIYPVNMSNMSLTRQKTLRISAFAVMSKRFTILFQLCKLSN